MRFKPYPEYKPSGVDWLCDIPQDWQLEKTKWLFEIKKQIAGELGHDILSVTQDGIKIKDTESGEGQLSMDYSKYQLVRVGDFAMNQMDLLTGYVDISQYDGVTSPDYRVFAARDTSITFKRYFLYLFQMGYKNKIFFPFGQGSSQLGRWRLPREQFNDFILPLPDVDEQERIAVFLDRETAKIDTLIAKQEKLIELLKEKRQAIISHAVTKGLNPNVKMKDSGIEWLGEVPEPWEVMPLWCVASDADSIFIDGDWIESKDISDDGFRYLTSGNVGEGYFKEQGQGYVSEETFDALNCIEVKAGDVLISRLNLPIGRACLAPEIGSRMVTCVDNVIVRPNQNVNRQFLVYMLSSKAHFANMENLARGTTMQRISRSILSHVRFALPLEDEQSRIAQYLDQTIAKIDTLIAKAEHAIALQKEHRTALISAAVTGKIDVREAA